MIRSLTHIFLHHWHLFHDHTIVVDGSMYIAGQRGAGKSAILDAIQLVLIADIKRIHFCGKISAFPSSPTDILDRYVRAQVSDTDWLRPHETVAFIALEWRSDSAAATPIITLGVCIEASPSHPPACTYFLLTEPFTRSLFLQDQTPRTRAELHQFLADRPTAHVYDHCADYQVAMRQHLGIAGQRFYRLFPQALMFQPVRNTRQFLNTWVLDERPIVLDTFHNLIHQLDELETATWRAEQQQTALHSITERQHELQRLRQQYHENTMLLPLLRIAHLEQRCHNLTSEIAQVRTQLDQETHEYEAARVAYQHARDALLRAECERSADPNHLRVRLQQNIAHATEQAEIIRSRWHHLRRDLIGHAQVLRPIIEPPDAAINHLNLTEEERDALRVLLDAIFALTIDAPPPPTMRVLIESAIPHLKTLLQRTYEHHAMLKQQETEARHQGDATNHVLTILRQGKRDYPPALDHLRTHIAEATGEIPPLLCELLDVPDERWQDAVEAMLGAARLTLIIQPRHVETALAILTRLHAQTPIPYLGILNIANTIHPPHPDPRPNALSHQVQTTFTALRPTIDGLLGNIIACENPHDLHRHARAITSNLLLAHAGMIRMLSPDDYRPWLIGERARHAQRETREREQYQIGQQWTALRQQFRDTQTHINRLLRVHDLVQICQRLDEPLDERPLREQIAHDTIQLESLTTDGIAAMDEEYERRRTLLLQEQRVLDRIMERRVEHHHQIRLLEETLAQVTHLLEQERQATADIPARLVMVDDQWILQQTDTHHQPFQLLTSHLPMDSSDHDITHAINVTEHMVHALTDRVSHELQQLTRETTAYNTQYQFNARVGDPYDERYQAEYQRLTDHVLPRYHQEHVQIHHEIADTFHHQILAPLAENILLAQQNLQRINDALSSIELGGDRYEVIYHPADTMCSYLKMLEQLPTIGATPLFESTLYSEHQTVVDEMYHRVATPPQIEAERQQQQTLTDYRSYFDYAIQIAHSNQIEPTDHSRKHSGAWHDTQLPCYLIIAAAFIQLYQAGARAHHPPIRLVIFDEAFAQMRQEHIAPALTLFRSFGLQVIAAAPIERCEYIIPHMDTTIVLTDMGDTIHIEPYHYLQAAEESS